MPPTFPIFLGLMSYIGLICISLIIFLPLHFFKSHRRKAMKVIATTLLSFPCLVLVLILFGLIFTIPTVIFSRLAYAGYIPRIPGIIMLITGVLIFSTLVIASALYLWYFISKIIYQKIDNKPVSEVVNHDRVFNILRYYLIKHKIIHRSDKSGFKILIKGKGSRDRNY